MQAEYIDHMGDDLRVVNAARVSFNKESQWEGLKAFGELDKNGTLDIDIYNEYPVLSEADQKLIRYLAKHNHWTPFSHVQITMREKVPIFVARQRFKHMVGFTYNEMSRRYVSDTPEFYTPSHWRSRPDASIKQGSGDEIIEWLEHNEYTVWDDPSSPKITTLIKEEYIAFLEYVEYLYTTMIENDVAPEQARMVLPQSMYTEYYVTGSLAAWGRAYKLRIDSHAQREIQELAKMWGNVISNIKELEHSWKALTE